MDKQNRYDVSDFPENQYQAGSNDKVLKNLLEITDLQQMNETETAALQTVTDELIHQYDQNHCFTVKDIRLIHKKWLGKIYSWAGEYRQSDMSKDGFSFGTAMHIPKLMQDFEKDVLSKYTPCRFQDRKELMNALAEVHVELVLIHPFREGNGRLARLLATLMALQAGLPQLNYDLITKRKKSEYFIAVGEGRKRNYKPMIEIFSEIINESIPVENDKQR